MCTITHFDPLGLSDDDYVERCAQTVRDSKEERDKAQADVDKVNDEIESLRNSLKDPEMRNRSLRRSLTNQQIGDQIISLAYYTGVLDRASPS